MSRIAAALMVAVLAGTSPLALGQAVIGKIGKRAPEFKFEEERTREIKFELDDLRGRIVIFYCWRASSAESIELFAKMRSINDGYRSKGVRIVFVTPEPRETMEKTLNDNSIDFSTFNIYYGGLFQMVYGAMSHPEVVLVDPFGYLVWRGHPLDELERRLDDIIALTPPHSGNAELLTKRLRDAERLSSQGDYGRAYTLAKSVFELTDEGESENGSADALMKQIVEAARSRITEATAAERAGDYKKAAQLLADLSVRMPQTDISTDVDNEIGRMRGDRNTKVEVRNAIFNAEGEMLMDDAAELESFRFYERAQEIYEKLIEDEKYEDTDVLAKAEAALERLQNDAKVQQRLAERRQEEQLIRWLELGDRFAKLDLADSAREHYERVVKQDAKSRWGQRAAERLAKLPPAEASRGSKPAGG